MKRILKFLISIPTFIILTYIYFFILNIIFGISFGYLAKDETTSGLWIIFMILSLFIGAILSLISTIKLLYKRKNNIQK